MKTASFIPFIFVLSSDAAPSYTYDDGNIVSVKDLAKRPTA